MRNTLVPVLLGSFLAITGTADAGRFASHGRDVRAGGVARADRGFHEGARIDHDRWRGHERGFVERGYVEPGYVEPGYVDTDPGYFTSRVVVRPRVWHRGYVRGYEHRRR